jgi:hypothetical protein
MYVTVNILHKDDEKYNNNNNNKFLETEMKEAEKIFII